jgi:hypothetical protein
MKPIKSNKRLTLQLETIRTLAGDALSDAFGAADDTFNCGINWSGLRPQRDDSSICGLSEPPICAPRPQGVAPATLFPCPAPVSLNVSGIYTANPPADCSVRQNTARC